MRRAGPFSRFTKRAARGSGHEAVFVAACLMVAAWLALGPLFRFSDTWQLTINTVTTVVTFLMVFIIQNTQTRDIEALHIKVDELVRAIPEAANTVIGMEDLPEQELHGALLRYEALAEQARDELERRRE
jgi:low affinity Fe/Cu permease